MTENLPDSSIAYVELYVADSVPTLEYFTGAFAFTARALAEHPDRYSVLLASGSARLIVTEPRGGGAVAAWLEVHGDGIRDVALYRPDLGEVVERAGQAGLPVLLGPSVEPGTGTVYACVGGFGSVRHTLLDVLPATDFPAGFAWQRLRTTGEHAPLALERIDHLAVCLPAGALESTVAAYQFVFDMQIIHSECIEIGNTAMNSHVLRDAAGLTYVMGEPDPAYLQVDQFLATHRAAGVQHLAFLTDDIVAAVRGYGARGVRFMAPPPAAYYGALAERVAGAPGLGSRVADLCETGVVLDRDHDGALYQTFTACPHERDALFYELVERRGSRGHGTNDIISLFEAREVASRHRYESLHNWPRESISRNPRLS
jgi:4-hydroxymandelate synthase